MQSRAAWLVALAMLGTALAGCGGKTASSGNDAIGIENLGAPGGPGPYRFTALVESENGNYTWDLGDRLTVKHGQTVEHTYDFKDSAPNARGEPGNVTVTLKVVQNGTVKPHTMGLRLGTGRNASPSFTLDGGTQWAVVGETVRFSAARSTDPEGDPLRYSWSCLVLEDAQKLKRQGVHSHGNLLPYVPPSAGSVTSYLANATLPEGMPIQGDMCEALKGGTAPSTAAATIQGTFTTRGKYKVILAASDGAHPMVSGSFDFYVTDPDERPELWQRFLWEPTLQAGAQGTLQSVCDQAPPEPQTCDMFVGAFELPLPGTEGWVNVTYDAGAGGQASLVKWTLERSEVFVTNGQGPDDHIPLTAQSLTANTYTLTAVLDHGANVKVTMAVDVRLNLDPFSVY